MASYKVTGKTDDGKQIGGTVHADSIGSAVNSVNSTVTGQGKTLASITVKPLSSDTGIKVSEPRKRTTKATGTDAAPASTPAAAAPAAAEKPASGKRK